MLALAWIFSVLPLALSCVLEVRAPGPGASAIGASVLPWIVLAGLPSDGSREWRDGLRWLACAAPPLALAARVDAASGAQGWPSALAAAVLAVALLFAAARRASVGPVHAVAWLVLVPGLPVFARVVRSFERGADAWAFVHLSPVELGIGLATGATGGGDRAALASACLGAFVVLLAAAFDARSRERRR